jgi:prolyl oligopeptidase
MRTKGLSRRRVLMGSAALCLPGVLQAKPVAAPCEPSRVPPAPVARREPVVDRLWGVDVPDPYRWMETDSDPEWLPFLKGQTAHARAVLDRLPGRAAHRDRIARWSSAGSSIASSYAVSALQAGGDRVFFARHASDGSGLQIWMRTETDGSARQVFAAPAGADGKAPSIDWWRVSPDGRHVAVGLSEGGSENATARIVEVDSGRLLPDRLERAMLGFVSWLADSSGFFITRFAAGRKPTDGDYLSNCKVWLHRIGTDPSADVLAFAHDMPGVDEADRLLLEVAEQPGEDWVLGVAFYTTDVNPVFVADRAGVLAGKPQWRRIADRDELVNHNRMSNAGIAVLGGKVLLLSNKDAPNGRILSIDPAAPDLAGAQVAVPEGDVVIQSFLAGSGRLAILDLDAGFNRLRIKPAEGAIRPVPLPVEGTVLGLDTRPDGGVLVMATGWLDPPTALLLPPEGTAMRALGLEPPPAKVPEGMEALRIMARARDGSMVPVSLIARKGIARDGSHPMLMHVYGAARLPFDARYDPAFLAFVEAGGIVAVAHVRGGGEYGRRWAEAAYGERKPVSYRDLIDCCEAVIGEGWTSPERLAITGASGAGMVLGMALVERPDLFAAVIPEVATLNMLRFEFTANGRGSQAPDMSVTTEQGFRNLLAIDGYANVREGAAYPAVLLTHGANDIRVAPWMSAKMAAAVQHATRSGKPVLLRIDFDAGHGIGTGAAAHLELMADIQAFTFWQTGVPAFQPRPC